MWVGKTKFENPVAQEIVEAMRVKLGKEFGVTVQGSLVTVRWYPLSKDELATVTMAICNVDDGTPDPAYDEDK